VQTLTRSKIAKLRERVCNVLLDLRFGVPLYGSIPSKYQHLGAHSTENSSYSSLEVLFRNRISANDVLVDVGCGKGRVINWWLSKRLQNRLVGIELDAQVAQRTRTRLRRFSNVQILTGNAIDLLPDNATCLFLYNPFGAEVMHEFKCRLKQILVSGPTKKITIIYLNCKHVDVFREDDQCSIKTGFAGHPFAIIEMRTA
jgi:SAM-dependent methyltransferase